MVFSDPKLLFLFASVLVIVVSLSFGKRSIQARNAVLLISSYFLRAQWGRRFLSLILFSTLVNLMCRRDLRGVLSAAGGGPERATSLLPQLDTGSRFEEKKVRHIEDPGLRVDYQFPDAIFRKPMQELCRCWYIFLSSYFRDYVYIPLGGSRTRPAKRDRSLLITLTLSRPCSGANWTIVVWGGYHGLLLVIQNRLEKFLSILPPSATYVIGSCCTFALVSVGWVVFRAETMTDAVIYPRDAVVKCDFPDGNRSGVLYVFVAVVLYSLRRKDTRLEDVTLLGMREIGTMTMRWSAYVVMFWTLIISMANRSGIEQFICFQF